MRNRKSRTNRCGGNIIESIGQNLDIPQDSFSGYAHIELCGNREAIVEGCLGILEYSDCSVAINTGKLTVRIRGCELTIVAMQNGQAIIKGIITCLDYSN